MRLPLALATLLATVVLLAVPAAAKDGVRAVLIEPMRLDSAPGTTLTVRWRLVAEDGSRFGASGIYLRVSRCGRSPIKIAASPRGGGYVARVTVPRGGLRKLVVGLEGWRSSPGRPARRADAYFQFKPPLARDCA
jgi:hypothetical protein